MNEEIKESIQRLFQLPDYFETYAYVEQTREALKLQEPISDKERLDQIQWIKQQYRKYVFSKQAAIEECGTDYHRMKEQIEDLISKATDSPKDSQTCIYMYMRDAWLNNAYAIASAAVDFYNEEE